MRSSLLSRLRSWQGTNTIGFEPLHDYQRDPVNRLQPNRHGLAFRLLDSLSRTWDLGITAFGGPPVLFQIVHHRFVDAKGGKVAWIDEQTVS